MIRSGPRSPALRRALVVALVAGSSVVLPLQMARGLPTTRFATLPAGLPGPAGAVRFSAAAVDGPEIPPPGGAVVDAPFPLSHLGVRWHGPEEARVDVRWAGSDGRFGAWKAMPTDHDLDDETVGVDGPHLSELVRVE
ncbi:MAG: hypothetical protein ACRDZ7_02455, partial [Acidimicrobiia bacterium]